MCVSLYVSTALTLCKSKTLTPSTPQESREFSGTIMGNITKIWLRQHTPTLTTTVYRTVIHQSKKSHTSIPACNETDETQSLSHNITL